MRFNVIECRSFAVSARRIGKKESRSKKTRRRESAWIGWKGLSGPEKAPAKPLNESCP